MSPRKSLDRPLCRPCLGFLIRSAMIEHAGTCYNGKITLSEPTKFLTSAP